MNTAKKKTGKDLPKTIDATIVGKDDARVIDTTEVNGLIIDEPMHWDALITVKGNIANNIIQQQALIMELTKKFAVELANNPTTTHALKGLMQSIHDIAIGVAQLQKMHRVGGVYRTGVIDNDDDILTYLRAASGYIAAEENLANLVATAHLDVFTTLATDMSQVDTLKDMVANPLKLEDAVTAEMSKKHGK